MDFSISSFLAAIVVMAAPLVLAALGETLTEKAGVVNLSLDGTILLGAMAGFVVASNSQSLLMGFIAAGITGCAAASILAFVGVWLGQSQVATGFALTFLCRDLAYFLGSPYARQQGPQLPNIPVPWLSDLPFVGKVFFSHTAIVYVSFIAIPCFAYFLFRTRSGLAVRMAGENPEACWARGINPTTVQITSTIVGGFFVGLAGAAFSLAVKPGWGHPQGCEGIGWIGLALVIFGSWNPFRVVLGAYLFGSLQLLGIYMQNIFTAVPPQIFQVAPFPLMIFTLVFIHVRQGRRRHVSPGWMRLLSGKPPQWLGKAYTKN